MQSNTDIHSYHELQMKYPCIYFLTTQNCNKSLESAKDLRGSLRCFFSLLSIRLQVSTKVNEKRFQIGLAHASQLLFGYCSLEIDVVSGSPFVSDEGKSEEREIRRNEKLVQVSTAIWLVHYMKMMTPFNSEIVQSVAIL